MVSLRFPFSFSQPAGKVTRKPPTPSTANSTPSFSTQAVAFAVAAAGTTAALAATVASSSRNPTTSNNPFIRDALDFLFSSSNFLPPWASLSLADCSTPVVHSKTGASFPSVLGDSQKLVGIGLRKKSVLGLKNIDVYAFGIYADDSDVKKLITEKYGNLSPSDLKENKEFNQDLMESDISMTVRLQIIYGKLSIRSVRSAFEESVGNRLQKFGGSDNKELLQRFTSQFKDEYKIPRGAVIQLSRGPRHVLHTTIDGKDVGSIQSKLLCRSILDLYMGDEPFDRQAKEEIALNLASLLQK